MLSQFNNGVSRVRMDMMYIQKNFTEIKKKGSNVRLWELEFKIEWTETVENEQNQ